MLETLEKIVTHPVALAIFGVASVGSMAYTILSLVTKRREKLNVELRTQVLFPGFRDDRSKEVTVHVDEYAAPRLDRDVYLFLNRTKAVITDQDFVELPVLEIGRGAKVARAWVEGHPVLGTANLDMGEGSVKLSGILLKPRRGLIVQVLHNGNLEARFHAILRLQPELAYVARTRDLPVIVAAVISGVFSAVTLGLLVSGVSLPKSPTGLLLFMTALASFPGLLTSFTARMVKRLIQGRTAAENALDALMSADTTASLRRFGGVN